jgi:hypothetical protein
VVEIWVITEKRIGLTTRGSACGSGLRRREEAHLLDDGKDPGLCVIVAICADTEIDLFLESIRPVGSNKAEQWVWRGQGNGSERGGHRVVCLRCGEVALNGCETGFRCA